jgi:hypothetical protein
LLIHKLAGGQYRTPTRFTTPATVALAAFITLSLAGFVERTRALRWPRYAWLVGAAVLALALNSGLLEPFPVTFIPDYRIYHEIGRDPDEYTLLEVPVGPETGFGAFGKSPDLEYYAQFHHKRLINGNVSRVPSGWLGKYERSPLLRGLTGEYDFPPLDMAASELAEKLDHWDMRYVLVHRDRLPPERARPIIQFLNIQPELCLVDEEGDLLSYRRISSWTDCPQPELSALPDQAGTLRLALGTPGDARYVGPGWYDAENIGGLQGRWAGEILTSTLRVLLPKQSMRVSFKAFAYPPQQVVAVWVNGQPVARLELNETPQVYQFDLPASALPTDGSTLIELAHTRLLSASERTNGQSDDKRPLAVAYTWFEFTPIAP